MKALLATILILSQPVFGQAAEVTSETIGEWEASLPQADALILSQIKTKAMEEYHFEDEGQACGGATGNYEMTDYYTFESFKGQIAHKIKLKFHVTQSKNYCRSEALLECEAPVTIYTAESVSMGKWVCTIIEN